MRKRLTQKGKPLSLFMEIKSYSITETGYKDKKLFLLKYTARLKIKNGLPSDKPFFIK